MQPQQEPEKKESLKKINVQVMQPTESIPPTQATTAPVSYPKHWTIEKPKRTMPEAMHQAGLTKQQAYPNDQGAYDAGTSAWWAVHGENWKQQNPVDAARAYAEQHGQIFTGESVTP